MWWQVAEYCIYTRYYRNIRNKWLRKVYDAQKSDPNPGDLTELLRKDCEVIKLLLSDQVISNIPRERFKNIVKTKIPSATFSYLQKMQGHSKIKNRLIKMRSRPNYLEVWFFLVVDGLVVVVVWLLL